MDRLLGAGVEGAVVVGVDDVPGVAGPRRVRRRVVHAEVEGRVAASVGVEEGEGVVGDEVGHVAVLGQQLPVANHRGAVVVAAAALVDVPVREPVLDELAVAEVPLARQSHLVAVGGEDIGVGRLPFEVEGRVVPDVAIPDPVVNAVLRRHAAGEEAGAARRADRRGAEEVLEADPGGGDAVEAGGADLVVAGAPKAQGPWSSVRMKRMLGRSVMGIASFRPRAPR